MTHVNAFRYRIEDAMRIVTKQSIKEAKVKQIKKEILASDKLTSHFKENPQDLEALRHDKVIFPTKILSHMKHVPSYLLPNSKKSALVGGVESEMGKVNFDPTRQVKRFKKRAGKEKSLDPLKEFAM